jgi:hypothetical protein
MSIRGIAAGLIPAFLIAGALRGAPAPAPKAGESAKASPASSEAGETGPAEAPGRDESAAVEGRNFYYDPAGRRDPFKSLLVRESSRSERPAGLAGVSIDEVVLEGIWKTPAGFLAQIKGADNRSYLLRKGDLLFDGEVIDVRPNELVLRQNINDPQSVKPFRDIVKRLNASRTE